MLRETPVSIAGTPAPEDNAAGPMRVVARRETCEGNAVCMLALPDRFVLDRDSRVVVEEDRVTESDYEDVAAAVQACPTASLRLEGWA